jgi:uncharacterized protein
VQIIFAGFLLKNIMKINDSKKITLEALNKVKIFVPKTSGKILSEVVKRINESNEIKALWKVMNVNATNRLGMTDHGPIHFQIVSNNGISMAKIFEENKIEFSVVKDLGLTTDHGETIIFLACILHDIGMSIHRVGHEEFSLFLANNLLKEILSFLPVEERVVVASETLHAIISHRSGGKPITLEAGIVRIADALDMSEGRSRIPYKLGNISIHSVSANAIKKVIIEKGKDRIIDIKVIMTNPAGMFQIDDLMQDKLKGSGIEKYISVSAFLIEDGKEKLFKEFNF